MTRSSEVYRTATLLIQEYGEFAPAGAFIKADQLSDLGDARGRDVWINVAKAAEELLSVDVPPHTVMH